ncbi:MAG TPA: TetR/AcrR family transcriptional regulator [Thermoanaerobaculaceae bacterium]|nr:TetR/AcrR family transcriptional regulator [Thermoanaerobaculaceae bacterium]HRS16868.1 TetR/AcrR family transcriptional regulator [Thermoanaerobaculaceae bacterium]
MQDTKAVPDESVRMRLLEAAIRIFNQKGYAATAVREIVEAAGVTKPALYYYFRSKEGIYLAILEEAHARFTAFLEACRHATGSARQRIVELLSTLHELMQENIGVVRLIHAVFYGPPQGAPEFDFERFHAELWNAIRDLVREGMASGEVRGEDVDVATLALHGAANMCMEVELAHPQVQLGAETVRKVIDTVFEGLAPRPATAVVQGR